MLDPFHEGERQVQEMAQEVKTADRNGTVISNRISGGALPFLRQQSMAVFASQNRNAEIWCSVLFGKPGFVDSQDGLSVDFDLAKASVQCRDPLWNNMIENPKVGMLAIELASRRRIRINGLLTQPSDRGLRFVVEESFPNCPKYITRHQVKTLALEHSTDLPLQEGDDLGSAEVDLFRRGDVLFIGTAHPTRGADASHRGGTAGFIEVIDPRTISIPDYSGNSMFNTLGNLAVNAHAGVTVPDFDNGTMLQLTGIAKTLWDQKDPGQVTGGTGRFLEFSVLHWLRLPMPAGVHTEFLDYSPFNPKIQSSGAAR